MNVTITLAGHRCLVYDVDLSMNPELCRIIRLLIINEISVSKVQITGLHSSQMNLTNRIIY